MAIRYFISLSCIIHAMVLIFLLSLFPKVFAEAIRNEIVVYIVEPLVSLSRAEEAVGTIEVHRPIRSTSPSSTPIRIQASSPGIVAPAKEEVQSLPAGREVRDLILPAAESPAEEFVGTVADKGVTDLADKGEGGLLKSEDITPDTASFNMEKLRELLLVEISGRKTYPASARKLGIEGEVQITFRVFPDGQFRDISANGKQERLTILEKAAVELVRNASPFPLLPSSDVLDISAEGVPIQLVISYQLEEKKGEGRE